MRKAFVLVALSMLGALDARANEAFLAAETVLAKKVPGQVPSSLSDARWATLPASTITLTTQRTVRLNDKGTNASVVRPSSTAIVRAAVSDRELALLVEWADATVDRASREETAVFGDAVALELPVIYGAGTRLPYIGMGDDVVNVTVSMQRAVGGGSMGRDYVAAGFGSLTRAGLPGSRMIMEHDAAKQVWRALFIRPLDARTHNPSLRAGLVPFALAAWDGARGERGGNKALSQWKLLRIEGEKIDAAYLAQLSYGYNGGDLGDVGRGKQLVESVCVACHRAGDKKMAPEGFAPDLSAIGPISTYGYLKESIVDPSAVIVPHLNPNRHYAKSAAADASGAYPNNQMYTWSTTDAKGKKMSKMTPFAAFPAADIAAMVAYLKTLGAPPPEQEKKQ